jgi:oxygen-independent coproporphyrinogen-3 oxidase
VTADRTRLTFGLLAADSVIFGLRMNRGVNVPALRRRFPAARWEALFDLMPKFVFGGLIEHNPEGDIWLSARGRLVADAIGADVLEAFEPPATVPTA